jgi:hypothetical protein
MLTKTRIALAAVLVVGSASLAVAQEADPNLLNRYPQANGVVTQAPHATLRTATVGLRRNGALRNQQDEIGNRDAANVAYDSAPLISGGGY